MFPIHHTLDLVALAIAGFAVLVLVFIAFKAS